MEPAVEVMSLKLYSLKSGGLRRHTIEETPRM
jgi:hypothetical protein